MDRSGPYTNTQGTPEAFQFWLTQQCWITQPVPVGVLRLF
jgi:hypothetical protein